MTTSTPALVEDYLAHLERELAGVPPARRDEIVAEIREHIAEAAPEGEAETRTLLDRLGDPEEIAAEARERFGVPIARAGWREYAALILLPIGGLIVPLLGWLVGVVMLWSSRVWSTNEKAIGTLVVPGGLLPAVLMLLASGGSGSCVTGPDNVERCTGGGSGGALAAVVLVVLVVAPVASAIFLASRLRRRT